jgi:DNA-binding protein HU-beta
VNKEDLVKLVADRTRSTQKDTQVMLMTTLDAIAQALARGERVTIVGFGTFQVRDRAAREGRNPRTGAVLRIPARKTPAFVAGKALRDRVQAGSRKASLARR